jgi:hypothetical protein
MNVLAIGRYSGRDFDAHIPAEKQRIAELRVDGFVRDVFFKTDKTGPILLLNDTDRKRAEERLATLPLVEEGFLSFERLIEFD